MLGIVVGKPWECGEKGGKKPPHRIEAKAYTLPRDPVIFQKSSRFVIRSIKKKKRKKKAV